TRHFQSLEVARIAFDNRLPFEPRAFEPDYGPPRPEKFSAHRRQGRLLAPDRFSCWRGACVVAGGGPRRTCANATRQPRGPDRLVGFDRARARQAEIGARRAET